MFLDLAMVVLDKCRKEYDNGERDYNYEFLEDFVDLYMPDECPKFNGSALNPILLTTIAISICT